MKPPRATRWPAAAALVAILAATAPAAIASSREDLDPQAAEKLQKAKEAFTRGVHQLNRRLYSGAESALQEATEHRSRSDGSLKVIEYFGPLGWEPYLPHYQLGKSRFHQGKYEQARASFREALAQGQISPSRHRAKFKKLSMWLAECEANLAAAEPSRESAAHRRLHSEGLPALAARGRAP